jgi:two-component system, OmpR family, sensor kinase
MPWVSDANGRLTNRVIVTTALCAAISAGMALVVAIFAIDHLVTEQADTRLRGATSILVNELLEDREEQGGESMLETLDDENAELVTSGIRLAVFDGGELVAGDLWVRAVPAGECLTRGVLGARSRGCGLAFERHVLVAAEQWNDASLRRIYLSAGVIALLVGALLAALTGVPLTRLALRPLHLLSETLRGVRPGSPVPALLSQPMTTAEVEEIRAALWALLQQGRALLSQAQTFAANAAHELRTPLTALRAEVELLMEEATSAADRAALSRIERRLGHLGALVERLLLLTAPVGEGLRGEAVALGDLTQEVVAGYSAELRGRLALQVSCEGTVRGDAELLRALLQNALDNALKFSAPSEVSVSVSEAHGRVTLDIIDAGPGVPSEERGRVFEPFYRMAGAVAPGHGLGLALIRHIALAHAGRASFLPRSGGAHLHVELPAWAPQLAPSQP